MEEGKQSEYNKPTQRINNMADYVVIEIGLPSVDRTEGNTTHYSRKTETPVFVSPTESVYRRKEETNKNDKKSTKQLDKMMKQSQYLMYPTKHSYYGSHVRKHMVDMYIDSGDMKCPSQSV